MHAVPNFDGELNFTMKHPEILSWVSPSTFLENVGDIFTVLILGVVRYIGMFRIDYDVPHILGHYIRNIARNLT